MLLSLAVCSGQATYVFFSSELGNFHFHQIENADSHGLSTQLAEGLNTLLNKNKLSLSELSTLLVVQGPGAFTGLRMSCSFMLGLARALNIQIYGISSYEFYNHDFYYPLRHQAAKNRTLEEALDSKIEFLHITGIREAQVKNPIIGSPPGQLVVGLKDNPYWPHPEQLYKASQRALLRKEPLEIFYGLNPKIFGQRTTV